MSRKPHAPTDETRNQVQVLAGFGVREDEISVYVEIDPKTLRKYYRRELDTGHIKANASVAKSLYNQAINGGTSAAIFWMKARAGWRETENKNLISDDGSMTPKSVTVVGVE